MCPGCICLDRQIQARKALDLETQRIKRKFANSIQSLQKELRAKKIVKALSKRRKISPSPAKESPYTALFMLPQTNLVHKLLLATYKIAEQREWQLTTDNSRISVIGTPKPQMTKQQAFLLNSLRIKQEIKVQMNGEFSQQLSQAELPRAALGVGAAAISQVVAAIQETKPFEAISRQFITSIVTQSLSILLAIGQFFTMGSAVNKTLSGMLIISSLTGLVTTIECICRIKNVLFDTKKVIDSVNSFNLEDLFKSEPPRRKSEPQLPLFKIPPLPTSPLPKKFTKEEKKKVEEIKRILSHSVPPKVIPNGDESLPCRIVKLNPIGNLSTVVPNSDEPQPSTSSAPDPVPVQEGTPTPSEPAVEKPTSEDLKIGPEKPKLAPTWVTWMPALITCIASILCVGVGIHLPKNGKFREALSIYSTQKAFSKDIKELTKVVISDVLGYELEGDPELVDALWKVRVEGAELLATPTQVYLMNSEKFTRLQQYPSKVDWVCTRKIDESTHKKSSTLVSSIKHLSKSIQDRIQEITSLMYTCPRPETVGLYLSGESAVGKTFYSRCLANDIAEKLGLSPRIYNLDKSEQEFWQPYHNEAFGQSNEFMARRAEGEPLLAHINRIVSADEINMEAASLNNKVSQCRLKLVTLTSNSDNPDLTRVLTSEAVKAFWGRFIRVRVSDPALAGKTPNERRDLLNKLNHRKSDNSHLQFHLLEASLENENDLKETPITIQQLETLILRRMVAAELKYIKEDIPKFVKTSKCDDELVSNERLNYLESLDRALQDAAYHGGKRITEIEPILPVVANAASGRVFICRIDGEIGKGKSYLIEKFLLPCFESTFTMPVVHVKLDAEGKGFPTERFHRLYEENPHIFVLDDILDFNDPKHLIGYHKFINSVHERSVILLSTNHVPPIKDDWIPWFSRFVKLNGVLGSTKIVRLKIPKECQSYIGIIRRMGFEIKVRDEVSGTEIVPFSNDSVHLRVNGMEDITRFTNWGKQLTCDQARDEVIQQYVDFTSTGTDLKWLQNPLPVGQYDIKVSSNSYDGLLEVLSSPTSLVGAWFRSSGSNPDPRLCVQLTEEAEKALAGKTFIKDWVIPPHLQEQGAFKNLAKRMIAGVVKNAPHLKVAITIGDESICSFGSYIWSSSRTELENGFSKFFMIDNKIMHVPSRTILDPEAFSIFYENNVADNLKIPATDLAELRAFYDTHRKKRQLAMYELEIDKCRRVSTLGHSKWKLAWGWIVNHPVITFIAGLALLALIIWVGQKLFGYLTRETDFRLDRSLERLSARERFDHYYDKSYKSHPAVIFDDTFERPLNKKEMEFLGIPWIESNPPCPEGPNNHYTWFNMPFPGRCERCPQLLDHCDQDHPRISPNSMDPDHLQLSKIWVKTAKSRHGRNQFEEFRRSAAQQGIDRLKVQEWEAANIVQLNGKSMTPSEQQEYDKWKVEKEQPTVAAENMVLEKDVIPNPKTEIENLAARLKQNVVGVRAIGRCYGLCLGGKKILAPRHIAIASMDGTPLYITHNGKDYLAKVIHHSPKRDLALLEVIDKQFPAMKKIEHLFRTSDHSLTGTGLYIRTVGDAKEVYAGDIFEMPNQEHRHFLYNERFHVTDNVISFCRYRIKASDYFRRGDCGLPLVISTTEGYKIAGIHIALSDASAAYFAGVTQEDLAYLDTRNPSDLVVANCKGGLFPAPHPIAGSEYKSDVWVNEEVHEILTTLTIEPWMLRGDPVYPNVLGFVLAAKTHSEFTNKKQCLITREMESGMFTKCEVMKACSATQYIPYDLPFKLPLNGDMRPDPLLLEIKKYSDPNIKWNPDQISLHQAMSLLLEYMHLKFGKATCRPLRMFECLNGNGKRVFGFEASSGTGFSVKKKWGFSKKSELLEHDGKFWRWKDNLAAQFVRNNASEKIECIKAGEPIGMMCKDCKKVELLPKEKVLEKAKVRLFVEHDFEDNLVIKTFFGDLVGKVHEEHMVEPIKIGYNPYHDPHYYMEQAHAIDGEFYSTDVSGMDKHFKPELMEIVIKAMCFCYDYDDQVTKALVISMLAHFNSYNGVIYVAHGGNMSGIYTTTICNSLGLLFAVFYDYVKQRRQHGISSPPMLKEFLEEHWVAIHGDDKLQRVRKGAPWNFEAQVENFSELGIVLTGSKAGTTRPEFCSRYFWFDQKFGVYYGALKFSSITGLLYYYSNSSDEQILSNLFLALFEAALHEDPRVYERVKHDVVFIAKTFKLITKLSVPSREAWLSQLADYIRGKDNTPMITRAIGCADLIVENHHSVDSESSFALKAILKANTDNSELIPSVSQNDTVYVGNLSRVKENMDNPPTSLDISRPDLTPPSGDTASSTAGPAEVQRASPNLPNRRNTSSHITSINGLRPYQRQLPQDRFGKPLSAYSIASVDYSVNGQIGSTPFTIRCQFENVCKIQQLCDADEVMDYWIERLNALKCMQTNIQCWLKIAHKLGDIFNLKRVYVTSSKFKAADMKQNFEGIRYLLANGAYYVLSASLEEFDPYYVLLLSNGADVYEEVTEEGETRWFLQLLTAGPNGDDTKPDQTPVVPDNIAQGMSNTALANIPSQLNPQPSGVAPTMAPPPQQVMGALEPVIQDQDLNCFGPPNMLVTGAIRFDIKDLIYEQFLDSDVQYTFTDDKEPGEIIFQIPYDPTSDFMSKYVRSYVSLHERFTGALKFRITVVGNPTFSGLVGVAWMPSKQKGSKIDISEAQKYAYNASGVELPSSAIYTLHDARQTLFWRKTDDKSDIDSRPHLVVFVMLTAVSPLRTGITVRLRVASRLANGRERDTFQVSNPMIASAPSKSLGVRVIDVLSGQLPLVYPDFFNGDWFLYSDGRVWGDSARTDKIVHRYNPMRSTFSFANNIGWFGPYGNKALFERNFCYTDENNLSRFVINLCQDNVDEEVREEWAEYLWKIQPERTNNPERAFERLKDEAPGYLTLQASGMPASLKSSLRAVWHVSSFGVKAFPHQQVCRTQVTKSKTYADMIFEVQGQTYISRHLIKVITTRGMWQMAVFAETKTVHFAEEDCMPRVWNEGPFPSSPIEETSRFQPTPELLLPYGYIVVRFSPSQPTAGPFEQQVSPTYEDDPILIKVMDNFSAGIPITQCIQFNLVDNVSQLRIGTFRYIQEHKTLVAYNPSFSNFLYMTYPGQVQSLSFSSTQIVNRTNDFPATDFSGWYSRSSEIYKQVVTQKSPHKLVKLEPVGNLSKTVSNGAAGSMIAGGMLGSAGSGLAAYGELLGMKELAGLNNAAAMERLLASLGGQKDLLGMQLGGQKELLGMQIGGNKEIAQMQILGQRENQANYLHNLFQGQSSMAKQQTSLNMIERGLGARTGMMGFSPTSGEIGLNSDSGMQAPDPMSSLGTRRAEGNSNSEKHPSMFRQNWTMALSPIGETRV